MLRMAHDCTMTEPVSPTAIVACGPAPWGAARVQLRGALPHFTTAFL